MFSPIICCGIARNAADARVTASTDAPPGLEARRARWLSGANLILALGLFALTIANLWWQWNRGENLLTGALFAFVATFYAGQMFVQFRDRRPQLVIGPAGLGLPAAAPNPIAWSRIRQIHIKRRFLPTLGGQIDIEVDPETFQTLRLGQRIMGDFVVKRRGFGIAFSVLTQGLDQSTAQIEAALKRHWPPDSN